MAQPTKPNHAQQFKEVLLERLRLRANAALSSYVLSQTDADVLHEAMADQLIATLDSHVYKTKLGADTHTIVEERPSTWKDARLMALKPGSFKRRFLEIWWDRPNGPRGLRVTHTITVRRDGYFPNLKVLFPPDRFGDVVHIPMMESPVRTIESMEEG